MHSKRRYKICIYSVILKKPIILELNYTEGLEHYFSKNEVLQKVRHFLIALSIKFFNPKILAFLFLAKKA